MCTSQFLLPSICHTHGKSFSLCSPLGRCGLLNEHSPPSWHPLSLSPGSSLLSLHFPPRSACHVRRPRSPQVQEAKPRVQFLFAPHLNRMNQLTLDHAGYVLFFFLMPRNTKESL